MTVNECLDHYRETGCVEFYAPIPEHYTQSNRTVSAYITITEHFLSAECQALRLDPEELDWFPY